MIRKAVAADVLRFPEVERSAAERFRGSALDWIADDEVSADDFYAPFVSQGLVWAAEARGQVVGFAACERFDDALHLWELAVAREHQGRGLGRALVAAAAAEGRARGRPALTLTTFRSIPWNGPFYASLGFEEPAVEDLPVRLRNVLAQEARRGFQDRCAMRLDLGSVRSLIA